MRQVGTSEAYKLAFDFHDDNNDARFCLRSVQSAVSGGVDVIKEVFTVDMGNVTCANSLTVGNNNSYPDIKLGSTNGNNISIATAAGSFSTSALVNDMVIRSINRLLLQSGTGGYGVMIDTNNYVKFNKKLAINSATTDTKTFIENLIIYKRESSYRRIN